MFINIIPQRLFQGPYPNNTEELIKNIGKYNTNVIVDLTTFSNIYKSELPSELQESIEFVKYPIEDYSVPTDDKKFIELIEKLFILYTQQNKNIFIHCQGGRGRSSIISCCLFAKINNITSGTQVIQMISSILHFEIPETYEQKEYIRRYIRRYV